MKNKEKSIQIFLKNSNCIMATKFLLCKYVYTYMYKTRIKMNPNFIRYLLFIKYIICIRVYSIYLLNFKRKFLYYYCIEIIKNFIIANRFMMR